MKTTDDRSDADLLLAYGRDGDEAAFEVLARRHVDMIFAVSLRRSNNRQLAEEATQNVLLGLYRKARKLSARERNLAGWLHKSTNFEISKLKRREARIKTREQAYASENMNISTQDEDRAFQRLYPLLDQAIDDLRTSDREVIVRRYLEGQSFSSIGQALGISEDAAQKRTSRAFEELNRFFKRKAGVTVSATAMAAGISQQCVEAAPASCLKILSNTATTGTTTGLTTSSIITSKTAAVAAGVILFGGAIALFTMSDEAPTQTLSSRAADTASPPLSSAGEDDAALPTAAAENASTTGLATDTDNSAGDDWDYSPNRELARLEAMNRHPGKEEFTRRLSVKHDRLLKDLTGDLGLSTTQVASVKRVLDTRLKEFYAALETGPQPGDTEQESLRKEQEMIVSAGEIIRGAGLRENLTDILSAEQLTAFDEREAAAWQTQVESHAYFEFSKIAPILAMTEEQKDRVFELLQASSDEILRADADERAFTAMQKRQPAALMDLPDPVEMKFIFENMRGGNPLAPNSPEFKEQAQRVIGARIDERVKLLATVLDEHQMQRYRDHLTQQSLLSIFSAKLPNPE